jgi:methionine-rich copper-binding protein CopC
VVAVAAALMAAAVALAHAEPARVRPGDGAILTVAPAQVEIEMSQEMARQAGANDIDVFDEAGREVTTVAAVIDNANRKKLSVALPADLNPGRYRVEWKSLSADDGDNASGKLSFTFDPAATANLGRESLREDVLGGANQDGNSRAPADLGDDSRSPSWIFVVAVGVAMFVLGGGGTFLLVRKDP